MIRQHTTLSVSFALELLDAATGAVLESRPETRNLILDSGLDLIANNALPDMIKQLHYGIGGFWTYRATAGTTVAAAGGVLTASGNFFVAADVGRIFKFNSGEEVRITGYTSATQVATSSAATIAADEGKIWNVNANSLVNKVGAITGQVSETVTQQPTPQTFKKTVVFLSGTFGTTRVLTELGWGPDSGALFGAKEIVPFAIGVGQQFRVTVNFQWSYSPSTAATVPNVGTGLDSSGTLSIDWMTENTRAWHDPNSFKELFIKYANFAQQPMSATRPGDVGSIAGGYGWPMVKQAYTAGNYYLDYVGTVPAGQFNGTIYGLIWGYIETINDSYKCWWSSSLKFATPQTMTGDDKLTVTMRKSWSRVLVN